MMEELEKAYFTKFGALPFLKRGLMETDESYEQRLQAAVQGGHPMGDFELDEEGANP